MCVRVGSAGTVAAIGRVFAAGEASEEQPDEEDEQAPRVKQDELFEILRRAHPFLP